MTKFDVRGVKLKAFNEVFDKIYSKEWEKDTYMMTKRRQTKTNDIGVLKCIKDKDKNILVQDENIKDRYSRHFDELFNEEQGHVVTAIILLVEKKLSKKKKEKEEEN